MPNLRFLALGDSYTIGEGVDPEQRWPIQLARALQSFGVSIRDPQIIALTGWTTSELSAGIRQAKPHGLFELVSLQIGVNDQYQAGDLDSYAMDFRIVLKDSVAFAGGVAKRVMVLSIPDWSVTPFAKGRDRGQIRREINEFNNINSDAARKAGAQYINITPISRLASQDPRLLTTDGLHPSGKMYARWIERVLPSTLSILGVETQ